MRDHRGDTELDDDLELTVKAVRPATAHAAPVEHGVTRAPSDVEEDTVQRLSRALSVGAATLSPRARESATGAPAAANPSFEDLDDLDDLELTVKSIKASSSAGPKASGPATEKLPIVGARVSAGGDSAHPVAGEDDAAANESEEGDGTTGGPRSRRGGQRYSRNRVIWGAAILAVLCLGIGFAVRPLIVSPSDAAARTAPPQAQAISVPIEERVVASVVTARADLTYEDPVDVVVEGGGSTTPMIVTGAPPDVGAEVDAGSVLLNVAGRPVIALPGIIPTYRTLAAGMSGPDIRQLKDALAGLGIPVGDQSSDTYDAATAAGVRQLYGRVGYDAPQPTKEESEALVQAQRAVPAAQKDYADANKELDKATQGLPSAERIALDNDVNAAQRALDNALIACANPPVDADAPTCSQATIDAARDELRLAEARRADALSASDTSTQWAAVVSASEALATARADVAKAQEAVQTKFPAAELVFVKTLPRRVNTVDTAVGQTLGTTAAMTLSGAAIQLVANVVARDAELLAPNMTGTITVDGSDVPVTVATIEKKTSGEDSDQKKDTKNGTRYTVTFNADALSPSQLDAALGSNVRVKVPIESTEGKVLAVPVAALTAGPGGESRIEVVTGTENGRLTTELVTVETGISADGFAEITNSSRTLSTNDRVVVGT